ncbi:TPA: hypothetical protein ACH7TX_000880 [Escherichia coli]
MTFTKERAAVETLESKGYTWHGGQFWKPPIGKAPAYITQERPAPVVPDEMPKPDTSKMFVADAVAAISRAEGWNACRAAMLQGAEPVSQRDELPYDPQIAAYEKIMAQAIPDGYALVPVEPTMAMLDEFDSIIDHGAEDSKDAWSRLLAAAPQQEVK